MTVVALIVVAVLAIKSLLVSWWAARLVGVNAVRTQQRLPTAEAFVAQVAADHDLGVVKIEDADVDGYVAARQTIQFAPGRRQSRTLSAVALAAHESAHMLQHATGYRPWQSWWVLAAPALICSWLAVALSVIAVVLGSAVLAILALVSLVVPLVAGAFSVVVERDAVRRASSLIAEQAIADPAAAALRRVIRASARVYAVETVFDLGFVVRRLGPTARPNGPRGGHRRGRPGGNATGAPEIAFYGHTGGDHSDGGGGHSDGGSGGGY